MARIAIGGLHHETNSFAPQPATFERFAEADGWPPLSRGSEILANTAGINLAISGFVEAASPRHELVPLTWANACPSGPVTRDAYERLAGMLVEDLAAAMPVDALFLDLHGAMVTEHLGDGEGELLRRLREVAPRLPIVAALDLHANVSEAMVALSDALVAYRTYPHVDLALTGARCLPLLEAMLAGVRLAKAFRRIDFLIPLPWQCTTIEPARSLYAMLGELEGGEVASASVCTGFPAADTPVCGPSVTAYGRDQAAADAAADRLARGLPRRRAPLRRAAVDAGGGGPPRDRGPRRPAGRARGHAGQSGRRRHVGHDGPARGADPAAGGRCGAGAAGGRGGGGAGARGGRGRRAGADGARRAARAGGRGAPGR